MCNRIKIILIMAVFSLVSSSCTSSLESESRTSRLSKSDITIDAKFVEVRGGTQELDFDWVFEESGNTKDE